MLIFKFIILKLHFCCLIFISLNILFLNTTSAQADLPNPPANTQILPSGSFVIPMDTTNQNIVPAGQAPFNLRAYGLINELLQNGIPVKWAINSKKEINDIDFTALAERYAPAFKAASAVDFRGGPFIVPDTVLPCGQSTSKIISAYGNNVVVYKLKNTASADIRYTLTNRIKIAVFNNGGNENIHTKILDAAGINDYDIMDAANIGNLVNCYTFASEPHADDDQISQIMIDGVRKFVMSGGNFLAQCHAVETYENMGFYHTTAGIDVINSNVDHRYPNANLAFTQVHGEVLENTGGSVVNWTLKNGSNWRPNVYPSITFLNSDTIIAMGAHLLSPSEPGGNIYYLGGHDYSKVKGAKNATADLSNLGNVNAMRLYLNAAMVPSGTNFTAWANAGGPIRTLACNESVELGCLGTGAPGSTFLWTPSTGLSCTTCPNPVAKPLISTTYKLQSSNTCIALDTVRVIVAPQPKASFNNTTVCQDSATSFNNLSENTSFWKWHFGDSDPGNNNVSTIQNPQHTYSTGGSFKVRLIAGTTEACADTLEKVVTVLPKIKINIPSDTLCEGQSIVLKATGASTYLWSTGAKTDSITVSPPITTVIKATGTNGTCISTDSTIITVSLQIIASISNSNVTCNGAQNGSVTVKTTGGTPGFSYNWNLSPNPNSSQIVNLKAGQYSVIITDAFGCSNTVSTNITEPTMLKVSIDVDDVKCNTEKSTASAIVVGGNMPYSFNWNTLPAQNTSTAENLPDGEYTVIVIDALECSTKATATILEKETFVLKTSVVNATCDVENDGSATVTASGENIKYTYNWNTTPAQNLAKAINLIIGVYIVKVTDSNGCFVIDSVEIRKICPPKIQTGNAFSPDNDSINDEYTVHTLNVGKFNMLIFNRWGEIIFESNERSHYWNGIYREEPMPIGVYAWTIIYEGESEEYKGPYKLEGSVTVVR